MSPFVLADSGVGQGTVLAALRPVLQKADKNNSIEWIGLGNPGAGKGPGLRQQLFSKGLLPAAMVYRGKLMPTAPLPTPS